MDQWKHHRFPKQTSSWLISLYSVKLNPFLAVCPFEERMLTLMKTPSITETTSSETMSEVR